MILEEVFACKGEHLFIFSLSDGGWQCKVKAEP